MQPMISKINLSLNEVEEHFHREIKLLQKLCEMFDEWDYKIANKIAISLRILLYDNKDNKRSGSKSLLSQLWRKKLFINTAILEEHDPQIKKSNSFLVSSLLNNKIHNWQPLFDVKKSDLLDFELWENMEITEDLEWNKFSRIGLIKIFADQDGWAHVDTSLEENFYKLTRQNSMGTFTYEITDWKIPEKLDLKKLIPTSSPAYYVVRQIAHEVLRSLGIKEYAPMSQKYIWFSFTGFSLN